MKKSTKVRITILIIIILIIIIVMAGISLMAQTTKENSGIYLNELDYKAGKLSYILSINNKMLINEFLGGRNVSLIYRGNKVNLAKSEIYGYRRNNRDFRFYLNEAYLILDTAGFVLYSHPKLVQQGKGYKPVDKYFYSISTSATVSELTIGNLWKSFPDQPGFRYTLQSNFREDGDLVQYDEQTRQYKIKYLYFQQRKLSIAHSIK
jgi:hypothetical protein